MEIYCRENDSECLPCTNSRSATCLGHVCPTRPGASPECSCLASSSTSPGKAKSKMWRDSRDITVGKKGETSWIFTFTGPVPWMTLFQDINGRNIKDKDALTFFSECDYVMLCGVYSFLQISRTARSMFCSFAQSFEESRDPVLLGHRATSSCPGSAWTASWLCTRPSWCTLRRSLLTVLASSCSLQRLGWLHEMSSQ